MIFFCVAAAICTWSAAVWWVYFMERLPPGDYLVASTVGWFTSIAAAVLTGIGILIRRYCT
jgi:hypothetical protein